MTDIDLTPDNTVVVYADGVRKTFSGFTDLDTAQQFIDFGDFSLPAQPGQEQHPQANQFSEIVGIPINLVCAVYVTSDALDAIENIRKQAQVDIANLCGYPLADIEIDINLQNETINQQFIPLLRDAEWDFDAEESSGWYSSQMPENEDEAGAVTFYVQL